MWKCEGREVGINAICWNGHDIVPWTLKLSLSAETEQESRGSGDVIILDNDGAAHGNI